jgi:hypothetical protein
MTRCCFDTDRGGGRKDEDGVKRTRQSLPTTATTQPAGREVVMVVES